MDNSILNIVVKNDVEVVDSRLLAIEINIQHKNLLETIRKYKDRLEKRGHLAFETETVQNSVGAKNQAVFYWLNERHCILLTTLCRNTEQVVELKDKIEESFYQARQANKNSKISNSELDLLKLEIEKLKLEKENIKLTTELDSHKLALEETRKLVKENQSLIKQSMECISLQDEKNFENGYYLQRLVEITDEHPFVKKVLDLKWAIKSTGYTFSHLSYTIRDLLKLFGVGDLNIRVVARNVSNVFQVEKKKLPSEKKETYKYTGEDLIYPVAVIACLRELNWEDLRDALEIDYKIKFPSSNRKFFPKNNN
jgi:phage regulator Rha-like protein